VVANSYRLLTVVHTRSQSCPTKRDQTRRSHDVVSRRLVTPASQSPPSRWTEITEDSTTSTYLHLRKCPVSAMRMSPEALHRMLRGNGLPASSTSEQHRQVYTSIVDARMSDWPGEVAYVAFQYSVKVAFFNVW